ncbi:MAG: DUF4097 domain-containing protein [Tannerella sp.]|jgi:hypothetical protein|nr:DUF4097 domain-containing protein [Tannerella sp.]
MKRLLTILSMTIIAGFFISSVVSSEVCVSVEASEEGFNDKKTHLPAEKMRKENARIREELGKIREENAQTIEKFRASAEKIANKFMKIGKEKITAMNDVLAMSEYKREIKEEFSVGASASLSISNMFGNVQVLEGTDDKITFKVTITGKGANRDEAKKYAESVTVGFTHKKDAVSAKTVFEKINCNNCGRNVDYEVYAPKGVQLTFDNQFGDIKINNTAKPFKVKLQFGKLYANIVTDTELDIQHGGATINKCKNMNMKSSFSKYKFGEIETLSGSVSYDGIDIEELVQGEVKSDFSSIDIEKLKKSFYAKKFSYGSLKIAGVDKNFSNIKVDASFSKVRLMLTESHNFKTTLYSSFGHIKTGNVVFQEKTLDKKDVVVGIVGSVKEPAAIVDISNPYGSIVLQ